MGNTQASDKQSKTGKSPAKGKHFIRNLNKKSQGRESKKHGKKKNDAKRDAVDREFDKTPDSDNVEAIETSDNDTVECPSRAPQEGEGESSVQSEVTVSRCGRSPTRHEPAAAAPPPAASPQDGSTSESVFTDPLTPLTAAVELNQCYYSAESDSAPDEAPAPRTRTPSPMAVPAPALPSPGLSMPHDDATSALTANFMEKEEKSDVFNDIADRDENEKVMGAIFSGIRAEPGKRNSHECNHDFLDNRLKASPGQTSFTISKHRKVELPPVGCEPTLSLLDKEDG